MRHIYLCPLGAFVHCRIVRNLGAAIMRIYIVVSLCNYTGIFIAVLPQSNKFEYKSCGLETLQDFTTKYRWIWKKAHRPNQLRVFFYLVRNHQLNHLTVHHWNAWKWYYKIVATPCVQQQISYNFITKHIDGMDRRKYSTMLFINWLSVVWSIII